MQAAQALATLVAENYHSSIKLSGTARSQNSSIDSQCLLSQVVMTHVWKRMITIYGHKWSAQYGAAISSAGLSDSAKTWQIGLRGVTVDQVAIGFAALVLSKADWPPSLPEFRRLCVNHGSDIPSLDEVVNLLSTVATRSGSIVTRYVHPLAYAVGCRSDMYYVRTAKLAEVRRHVAGTYKALVDHGWNDWPDHARDVQDVLPMPIKQRDPSAFKAFRAGLNV